MKALPGMEGFLPGAEKTLNLWWPDPAPHICTELCKVKKSSALGCLQNMLVSEFNLKKKKKEKEKKCNTVCLSGFLWPMD